jgi:predicted nucleotidyltransferase
MKTKITPQLIRSITATIVKKYQPEKVILFGSYAWGKPNKDSDLDLFIVKKSRKKRFNRQSELRELLKDVSVPMDILVFTPKEVSFQVQEYRNLFIEDIVEKGKILYKANA